MPDTPLRITPSTDRSTDDATGSPITEINKALGKHRDPPSPVRRPAKALIAWRRNKLLTPSITRKIASAIRTIMSPEEGTVSPEKLEAMMKEGIDELCHRSMMDIYVKEKIAKEHENYSEVVGVLKKKHRQSLKAVLGARYDARVQGVIAPSHRMGVLSERDRV